MVQTKVATCCYCGTRAALVLRGTDRHELACSSCGAPLTRLKMLPIGAATPSAPVAPRVAERITAAAPPVRHAPPARPGKRKKTKSLQRKIAASLWDAIEDIFD